MPPAASAAVAIRKSRSARSRAAAATSPSTIGRAGASSKAMTQTRRVRSRPSWPETVHPSDLGSTRNIAGPDSVTASAATTSAAWAARTYHRWPSSRQPPGARSARTLSGPNTQRPPSSAAATVAITDPSASNGSHCSPGHAVAGREQHAAGQRRGQERARVPDAAEFAVYHARLDLGQATAAGLHRDGQPGRPGTRWPGGRAAPGCTRCGFQRGPQRGSRKLAGQEPRVRVSCRACWCSLRGRVSLLVMAAPSRFMLADESSSFRAIRGWCLLACSCLLDGAARPVDVRQQLRVRAGGRAGRRWRCRAAGTPARPWRSRRSRPGFPPSAVSWIEVWSASLPSEVRMMPSAACTEVLLKYAFSVAGLAMIQSHKP